MTWVSEHRADIMFLVGMVAGAALIIAGLLSDDTSTIMLGAGAIGIPGFMEVSQ